MSRSVAVHLPPEWAAQAAVLLAWPDPDSDFGPWLEAVEATYRAIALEVTLRETLIVACRSKRLRDRVSRALAESGVPMHRVRPLVVPYDDVWVRDMAPLTVATPQGPRLLGFRFNGWGGKYPHASDARFARRLHETGLFPATPFQEVDLVLEGGSIESDGAGTLLATSRCLRNPNRNPALSGAQIAQHLRRYLGVERLLWLEHGYLEGDDTDAHIDTLARFCSPDTLAYSACDDPTDPLFEELRAMGDQLRAFTDAAGRPYRLLPLPIPKPIYGDSGQRLPASYANFLIINGAVLVPVYGDPADRVALERLAQGFPDRCIVAIDCTYLIRQYGSLHCATMQFPNIVGVL
ncbi:agmatine deiminase family protein [Candidatus Methylocalor cossyra]|uniref:Agmatine deiminase n=1 Tax=Candidatus Methylocalor cossyra TaxID=3108543 RepID=A0ABM9NLW7_9GAMM